MKNISFKDGENICFEQLKQFQNDLESGDFYAQQMCDAWGEDVDFENWPGLQFQLGASESTDPADWRQVFTLQTSASVLIDVAFVVLEPYSNYD